MANQPFQIVKTVSALPVPLAPNVIYLVRVGQGYDLYATDTTGSNAYKINVSPSQLTAIIGIENGGTGAKDVAEVRSNLDVYSKAETVALIPAGSGGGLANLSEVLNTQTPNAAVPVAGITPNRSESNADLVLRPKGTGSIIAAIPDNGLTGGNKRGTYAVDLQLYRGKVAQVASGQYSFASGHSNTASGIATATFGAANIASGDYSTTYGLGNVVSGTYSIAVGQSNTISNASCLTVGKSNSLNHAYCTVLGQGGKTRAQSSFTLSFDAFNQVYTIPLARSSNGAVSLLIPVLYNSIRKLNGVVVAKANSNTEFASWTFDCTVTCGGDGSTHTILGAPTITKTAATTNAASWTCMPTTTTTNFALLVDSKGTAVKWLAKIDAVEVC